MKKKRTNDEKIIAALDALDKSVRIFEKFGARYDEHIDRAAIASNDKRARQLIRQKISVYSLIEQLKSLKSNFELGAYTAQVVSDMSALPDAISACKGLLAESPNFSKLGESLKKIFKDMQQPISEIEKLNDILDDVLSPSSHVTLASRLDEATDIESSDKFNAEYAAMIERIKPKIAPEYVAKAADTNIAETGDIDFDGIIAEENKRK